MGELAYVVGLVGVLGFAFGLFVFKTKVGVPPRIRTWMDPFASPAFALAGLIVVLLVYLLAYAAFMLVFGSSTTAEHVISGATVGIMLAAVAFFTARWWQPLYLAGVTWAVVMVVGLFEQQEGINQPEGETAGDVLELTTQVALFTHIWLSQGSQAHRGPRVPLHHP